MAHSGHRPIDRCRAGEAWPSGGVFFVGRQVAGVGLRRKQQLVGEVVGEQVGRHAQPADIAPVLAFLLSPDAGWVMGQDIQVDGGFLAGISAGAAAAATFAGQQG